VEGWLSVVAIIEMVIDIDKSLLLLLILLRSEREGSPGEYKPHDPSMAKICHMIEFAVEGEEIREQRSQHGLLGILRG